jgi:hypothetical protein
VRWTLGFLLAAALLAAGCGVRNSKPFTASGSMGCFREKGFTNVTGAPARVGPIAAFAEHGGLQATSPSGNVLTIAFTADEASVASTEEAYRTRAPKSLRPHLSDIMSVERNAVLVWTVTPKPDELDAAMRCLKP